MIMLQTPSESGTAKAMVFTIAGQTLALPLSVVLKVIATPPHVSTDYRNNTLIYIDNQPIALLNLHPRLSRLSAYTPVTAPSSADVSASRQYLLIASVQGVPYGIFIDNSPLLLEIPFQNLKLLPETYRQALGGSIHYVCVMPQPEPLSKILLLNLPPILQAMTT
jgi:hypothetical protein